MNSVDVQKYIGYLCEAEKALKEAQATCVTIPLSRLRRILSSLEQEYNDALAIVKSLYASELTPYDRIRGE